jgi:hypothetical protein
MVSKKLERRNLGFSGSISGSGVALEKEPLTPSDVVSVVKGPFFVPVVGLVSALVVSHALQCDKFGSYQRSVADAIVGLHVVSECHDVLLSVLPSVLPGVLFILASSHALV